MFALQIGFRCATIIQHDLGWNNQRALKVHLQTTSDEAVRELLNELAGEIGTMLDQEEVHIAYRDSTWTLKRGG